MSMNRLFRRAMFGGFNREDVTEYIAKSAHEHKNETVSLKASINDLAEKNKALEAELNRDLTAALKNDNIELGAQNSQMKARIDELTASGIKSAGEIKSLEAELEDREAFIKALEKRNAILNDEKSTLSNKLFALEEENISLEKLNDATEEMNTALLSRLDGYRRLMHLVTGAGREAIETLMAILNEIDAGETGAETDASRATDADAERYEEEG